MQGGEGELPDDIFERLTTLSEEGDIRLDASDHDGAVEAWGAALALSPPPQLAAVEGGAGQ